MKKYEIVAYCNVGWLGKITEEDLKILTGVNIAFGKCNEDHSAKVDHIHDIDAVKRMKEINPDIRVMISMGGACEPGWSNAAYTKAGRERLVSTTLDFVRAHNLDGVDLDWEFPTRIEINIDGRPEDRYTYTMLCEGFRAKLDSYQEQDGKYYWLTMASGADMYMMDVMEVAKIANILDYIHLMTYDLRWQYMTFQGGPEDRMPTSHHTNLYPMKDDPTGVSIERSVNMFLNAGVPANKLLIGAAFYTKRWENVRNQNNGLYQPSAMTESHCVTYKVLKERFLTDYSLGYKEYWDDDAKAPYLFNGYCFISYDNPRSMREKVKYVKKMGLRGVMFWEYSCDPTGELLDALYSEIEAED